MTTDDHKLNRSVTHSVLDRVTALRDQEENGLRSVSTEEIWELVAEMETEINDLQNEVNDLRDEAAKERGR